MAFPCESLEVRGAGPRQGSDCSRAVVAARSHARAAAAQKSGRFDSQIVPVRTQWRDPKTKEVTRILVEKDDGIREGTTLVS